MVLSIFVSFLKKAYLNFLFKFGIINSRGVIAMGNFDMEDYMENYMKKSVGFKCPSCGASGMMAKPEKDGKFFCPSCGCIIRGDTFKK